MINIEKIKKYDVISFDIFDTLLTRKYINPTDVFYEMQNQLKNKFNNFAEQRIKAELECRRQHNFSKEVTIEEIYNFLFEKKYIDNLLKDDLKDFISLELQIEKNNLYVNEEIRNLIEQLRKLNKKIILISDIYLSKQFLKEVLNKLNINFDLEDMYISSELKVMKSNKKLFEFVLKDLDINSSELIHIGDNKVSDYENPKSLGINAFHYHIAVPNRYENQEKFENIKLSRLRALSRKIRLENPYKDEVHKFTIWNTTANVSAPLMTGFTLWCLKKAKELNLKKIYFCSRDGEILYKIAKEVLPKLNLDLEIDYLYVSRQSLLFPSIKEINNESLEWIIAPTAILTPNIILKRINFEPEEIFHCLKEYGFHNKLDKHLSIEERQSFRKMLKSIEDLIVGKAKGYRENTKAYLKQKGLYKDRFALIDIGWSGTLQRSISQFLAEDGYNLPTYGLYFGVKRRKKFKDEDQLHGWFTDHRSPRGLDKKTYIIPMTELFTAALHGGVHSHIEDGVSYKAKLLKEKNETGLKWGVDIQQAAIVLFAKKLSDMPFLLQNFMLHQELNYLEKNYEKLLLNPSLDEAKTYGAYEDAEDQNESYHVKLAQPYTLFEQIKMIFKNNYKHHHNEWKEGALRLTKENSRIFHIKFNKNKTYESNTENKNIEELTADRVYIGLHIPKTAGSSLIDIVKERLDSSSYFIDTDLADIALNERKLLEEYFDTNRIKFVFGHHIDENTLLNFQNRNIFLFTFIREPVERVISQYFFENKLRKFQNRSLITFEEFYKSLEKNMVCKWLSEKFRVLDDTNSLYDRAIASSKIFNLIISTTDFDEKIQVLLDKIGIYKQVNRKSNISKYNQEKELILLNYREQIIQDNYDDFKLYNEYLKNKNAMNPFDFDFKQQKDFILSMQKKSFANDKLITMYKKSINEFVNYNIHEQEILKAYSQLKYNLIKCEVFSEKLNHKLDEETIDTLLNDIKSIKQKLEK